MTFPTWQEEWAFSTTAERWEMLANHQCPPWVYVHFQLLGRPVTGLDFDHVHQPGFEDVCRRACGLAWRLMNLRALRSAVLQEEQAEHDYAEALARLERRRALSQRLSQELR